MKNAGVQIIFEKNLQNPKALSTFASLFEKGSS